jgi:PDZ domain-containing protein
VAWLRSPVRLAVGGVVLLAIVGTALFLVPSNEAYLVLPDRARPVEPLVEVEGGRDVDVPGGIYFVNVIVRRASVLERIVPAIHEGAEVVPAHEINPTGVSEDVRREASLREMTRSQRIAAAVALRTAGEDVSVRRTGARVDVVVPGRPAARRLRAGDTIVEAGGHPVRSPEALRSVLATFRPGQTVALEVRRGRRTLDFSLRTAEDPTDRGRAIIGVLVSQAADIRLPREVEIDAGGIGGPSAGLAFALDLLEELGRDVDRGRRIAVTGALRLDGTVEPVGGVKQKTIGVRRAGIEIFVVPAGENAAEARANADGVRVVAARTFQQTLRALATLGNARRKG